MDRLEGVIKEAISKIGISSNDPAHIAIAKAVKKAGYAYDKIYKKGYLNNEHDEI